MSMGWPNRPPSSTSRLFCSSLPGQLRIPLAWSSMADPLIRMTFSSATQEQLRWIMNSGMDHVTCVCQTTLLLTSFADWSCRYTLLILSAALLVFLWANMLLSLYANSGQNASTSEATSDSSMMSLFKTPSSRSSTDEAAYGLLPTMEEVRPSDSRRLSGDDLDSK